MATAMKATEPQAQPLSVKLLLTSGLQTSRDCANVLAACVLDVGLDRITPQKGNTMFNGIGKIINLKKLELQHGVSQTNAGERLLQLADAGVIVK